MLTLQFGETYYMQISNQYSKQTVAHSQCPLSLCAASCCRSPIGCPLSPLLPGPCRRRAPSRALTAAAVALAQWPHPADPGPAPRVGGPGPGSSAWSSASNSSKRLRVLAKINRGKAAPVLSDTLALLNSSANGIMLDDWASRGNRSGCIRCAVVGNGGILKDSEKGEEIDSHHYVFRTNGAVVTGFEKDVGVRTTHYTFSTNTLMNSMMSYASAGYRGPPQSQETRYVFLPDHDRDYLMMKAAAQHTLVERGREQGKDPTAYFGKDVTAAKLKMYHPDFIRYLRNRFLPSKTLKTKHRNIYRPSTGAIMLLAALHSCDRVSAYGFMTPQYKKYSDHYYDKQYHRVGFFINHDLMLEMNLWQRLHQAGLITLYMRL
ncbi:alpha-N-acetylgalactosaminide alpha-2,6-sialyltransferase 2 isoform X2 [Syngnathus typhle]|uniref:alpha-N-acetylgalactosaminide alpha-2,6-sialyltransferase 2 isoform X2 n=1 Tax=Syngnathus typhle TaxID=161592 RepID=UPI002A6B1CD0|nr:alpha-N-acetylgalactosaminide alpha-2,6-sialyltransferase 2 isoform X2 [Syngnathus typhle]